MSKTNIVDRSRLNRSLFVVLAMIVVAALGLAACTPKEKASDGSAKSDKNAAPEETASKLKGRIKVDGSSTVFPITEAVGEEFQKENPDVQVTVGVSGTGGGFEKFVIGETDISDASRPIKDEEKAKAEENGIEYIELTVAFDGLSVMVNPENDFVSDLTVDELKKIWNTGSEVKTWKDVRDEWPADEIKLFGPGTDSGTFDYFTDEINGEEGASRSDYTASEDDNTLVQGIAGEKNALGYFGYAYFIENQDKLKLLTVDGVRPSPETIRSGDYKPLSRPLFIYVSKKAMDKPEVKAFVEYYLENGAALSEQVGYVPMDDDKYSDQLSQL